MLNIDVNVVMWLISWSFIGSSLGFFTIRNRPQWTKQERFREYFKSITVGIFFAFPTYIILTEKEIFSVALSIMIAGSVAFAITDMIISIWPRLMEGIGVLIIKLVERNIGR